MHIESLNLNSFAKRASTSHTQLPPVYAKGPFCQTCQSNQLILINLLSNYLPSPADPEYSARLEVLPQYRESLHLRYPPVCAECLPAVEDEIQKKNHMARTKALGGWLNESKGKEKRRRVSEVPAETEKISAESIIWRIRGFLWMATSTASILYHLTAVMGYSASGHIVSFRRTLPIIALTSLLWAVWDPTYLPIQRAKRQGRDIRVRGMKVYVRLQLVAWCSRFATSIFLAYDPTWLWLNLHMPSYLPSRIYFGSSLIIELTIVTASCWVIRFHQPPTVRLIQTDPHKSSRSSSLAPSGPAPISPPGSAEPELIAALSLSSNPIISPVNPVFGLPSLLSRQPSTTPVDEDAMDWTPTHGQENQIKGANDSWLRPQRFFAPEKPTGLEGLFERALLVNDEPLTRERRRTGRSIKRHLSTWWWVYMLSFAPACGVLYKSWSDR